MISDKKLLFDGSAIQSAANAKFHGGSEFGIFILKHIIKSKKSFSIAFDKNKTIRRDIHDLLIKKNINIFYFDTHSELYKLIKDREFDIFYSALPYEYSDYNLDVQFKGVIHGLRNIEMPWDNYKHKHIKGLPKKIIGYLISKSNLLIEFIRRRNISKIKSLIHNPYFSFITVSEHSKYSIKLFFPETNLSNIPVVYSPIKMFEKNNAVLEYAPYKSYYLLISANRFEKNPNRLVKAFDKLFSSGLLLNKKLVLCGVEDKKSYGKIKNKENFIFVPYLNESELSNLMSNAYCFVYPSLNEGFGYPPLQAMHLDVPVLASSATSIPEVCGDAALYFSPDNIYDIANRILQIEYNSALYNSLIIRGKKRVDYIIQKQSEDIEKYIEDIFE